MFRHYVSLKISLKCARFRKLNSKNSNALISFNNVSPRRRARSSTNKIATVPLHQIMQTGSAISCLKIIKFHITTSAIQKFIIGPPELNGVMKFDINDVCGFILNSRNESLDIFYWC